MVSYQLSLPPISCLTGSPEHITGRAKTSVELERIGAEVEARLRARRELGEAERTAREEELEHTIYSQ